MSGDSIYVAHFLTHAHGLFAYLANGSSNELPAWSPGPVAHRPPPSNIRAASASVFDLEELVNHNSCLTSSYDAHRAQRTRLSFRVGKAASVGLVPRLHPKREFKSCRFEEPLAHCSDAYLDWRAPQRWVIGEHQGSAARRATSGMVAHTHTHLCIPCSRPLSARTRLAAQRDELFEVR